MREFSTKPNAKKKPMRNWRRLGVPLSQLFDARRTENIARESKFPNALWLRGRLNDAAENWQARKQLEKSPRISDQKKYLEVLVKCTESLHEHVRNMAPEISFRLSAQLPVSKRLLDDIKKLNAAAKRSIKELAADRGGPRKDIALSCYIEELVQIYEEGVGKKARVSYDSIANKFTGPLYRFVEKCVQFKPLYPKKSNAAIGQQIRAVLNSRKKRR